MNVHITSTLIFVEILSRLPVWPQGACGAENARKSRPKKAKRRILIAGAICSFSISRGSHRLSRGSHPELYDYAPSRGLLPESLGIGRGFPHRANLSPEQPASATARDALPPYGDENMTNEPENVEIVIIMKCHESALVTAKSDVDAGHGSRTPVSG